MNSILHTCTHSDDDTLLRMTEDQMYLAIFNYIDHLFEMIKPKEVFYMAIDGVAPRAKMNQQRARRFRTAYEAEMNLAKAVRQGAEIPKEDPFDSNAITPGTEFMAKLTDNLKYFIHKKISEDARWANIKVVLSGHEVPGEGEHKIMQYIRAMKAQPKYNPNLRHCIYGLDADLIVLGLVTHDLHFSLLREEVVFGGRLKKITDVSDQKFFLLHLSLVREYMELEFQDLKDQISFPYNFERILDDFILIMYVIGNDFLPHLPDLHINKGAFPLLIGAFKQSIIHMDGYINKGGKINFQRLSIWLDYLSEFELENFERDAVDIDWFNKKLEDISITGEKKRARTGKVLMLKDEKELVDLIQPWLLKNARKPIAELTELANLDSLPALTLPTELATKNLGFLKTLALETGFLVVHSRSNDTYETIIDVDGISPYESDEDYQIRVSELKSALELYQSANVFSTQELKQEAKDLYDQKFMQSKDKYYKEKLHFSINDNDKMIELTRHYCEGLQWVLYYYYKGCPSWNWYYKYHYSPRISDINMGIKDMISKNEAEIKFDQATPFKPFEQLMAVLPARSRKLMPEIYRPLMTDERSPIIDFYPHEVEVDLNGKTASWEAVVLLSFVDEKRLLDVLRPMESKLTPEEKKRNSYGNDISFIFNPQINNRYPSPLPGFYHDLEHDKCYEDSLVLPTFNPNFEFDLPKGAKLGKDLLAGFPSLKTIPFDFHLALLEVKIFNFPSKSESMNLTLHNRWVNSNAEAFTNRYMGKLVYTSWPYLSESRVTQVRTAEMKYESVKLPQGRRTVASTMSDNELREFHINVKNMMNEYKKNKGVMIGPVDTVVFVQRVNGLVRTQRGAYVKTFKTEIEAFPLQLVVESVRNEDSRFASRGPVPVNQEYPVDLPVVFLGAFAYGSPAVVAGHSEDGKLNIRIDKIQSTLEPNIGKKRLEMEKKEIRYLPSFEVAKLLKVNGLVLSKITGDYTLRDGNTKYHVGLDIKFDARRLKALGYSRKTATYWEYSPLAVQLLKDYKAKFPTFFKNIVSHVNDMPSVKDVTNPAELKSVQQWLKSIKSGIQMVSLESESLTRFSITSIEDFMEDYVSKPLPLDKKDVKGVPTEAIINPTVSSQLLKAQRFDLGDRVIYVQDSGKVPKLSKGTVVAISTLGTNTSLSVVFDFPLVGGNNMGGKLKTNRGTVVDSSLVLNISHRQLLYHSNASRNKKPISNAERAARMQMMEANKAKKQEEEEKKSKERNTKSSHELLSLLKRDKTAEKTESAEGAQDDERINDSAIKLIYGHIYNNVMSQGAPPQGMVVPPFYGPGVVPQPPLQQPVAEHAQQPVANNQQGAAQEMPDVPGIPLPPQFRNSASNGTPPPMPKPANGRGRGRGGARGNFRGRGGRGGRGGKAETAS